MIQGTMSVRATRKPVPDSEARAKVPDGGGALAAERRADFLWVAHRSDFGRPDPGRDGKRRYATVVTPVPPNKLGRLRRKSLDRIKTTETLKFPASVGAQ